MRFLPNVFSISKRCNAIVYGIIRRKYQFFLNVDHLPGDTCARKHHAKGIELIQPQELRHCISPVTISNSWGRSWVKTLSPRVLTRIRSTVEQIYFLFPQSWDKYLKILDTVLPRTTWSWIITSYVKFDRSVNCDGLCTR